MEAMRKKLESLRAEIQHMKRQMERDESPCLEGILDIDVDEEMIEASQRSLSS